MNDYYDTHQPLQGTYTPVQHYTESENEGHYTGFEGDERIESDQLLENEVARLLQEDIVAHPKKYRGSWEEWSAWDRRVAVSSQIFHDTPLAQQALKNIKGK